MARAQRRTRDDLAASRPSTRLTPAECGLLLGVSGRTVRRMIHAGIIRAIHVGRDYRVFAGTIVRMQERRRVGGRARPVTGRRSSDPALTIRECADRCGMSTAFIRNEIRAGALHAALRVRRQTRTTYRIAPGDFAAWAAATFKRSDEDGKLRPLTRSELAALCARRHPAERGKRRVMTPLKWSGAHRRTRNLL